MRICLPKVPLAISIVTFNTTFLLDFNVIYIVKCSLKSTNLYNLVFEQDTLYIFSNSIVTFDTTFS